MNYRPITIVSCLGKLFTAILNARLNDYTEEFMILKENQSGFKQSYSGYWTRAIKRFALFDLLKSLYSDTNILSKYIPSLQKKL